MCGDDTNFHVTSNVQARENVLLPAGSRAAGSVLCRGWEVGRAQSSFHSTEPMDRSACEKGETPAGSARSGRILVAEDDEAFRSLIVQRVRRQGYSVLEAGNAVQASSLVRTREMDLLVLDMYLPDGTGLDILKEARTNDSDILAIVMTGSATVQNAVESLRAGVFEFLTKPIDPIHGFDLALFRAMEQRRLVREVNRLFVENQRLALQDALTGLYNRFQMRKILDDEIKRSSRYDRSFAIMLIDLDKFKKINDTYGHIRGDEVLVHVADVIRSSIRSVDSAVRFGGDEFLVIMPEADIQAAVDVGRRIIRQMRVPVQGVGQVGVSLGAAVWEPSMKTIEALLAQADHALYRAKAKRQRCP